MPDCKSKEIASVCKTLDEYQNRMITTVIVYPSRHSLNRILAFQSIVSLEQKKKFDNVIWDTSVQKYESQDGENERVEKGVRNYRLKFSTKSITQIQSQNKVFGIQGNPPQGATK